MKCGITEMIELLGGRYRLLILRALLYERAPLRFGELKRVVGNISQKTLTSNLRALEACGVVKRKVFAEVPPRVEYRLTEAGERLMPVFLSMGAWAKTHLKL